MSMATNFLETAKNLKEEMQALLHKLDATKGTIGTLLDNARRTEGSMIDREEREKQEREERERAERLKAMLESGEDVVAHAGGAEEPEPQPEMPEKPAEVRQEPQRTEERPQRAQNAREQGKDRPQGERRQGNSERPQGERRQGNDRPQGERRQNDSRAPRRDNSGSSRTVVINVPSPSDTGKNNRTDKKKPFDTTDKKAKSKKTMMKEQGPTARGWEDDSQMGNRRKVKKHEQEAQQPKPAPVVIDHAVITAETITVKDLSEKLGKPANEILKKLLMLGIIANINQELDFDTCELIASEFNITLEQQLAKSFEDVLLDKADDVDAPETLKPRPPVVTIMGHVDHGKTSLLDAIRNSHVTAGEAGGITQHIGAYTVTLNGKQITFIDTPGHEAFTAMRARGAQVTDIVILVVAADDGIMPQTIEAINHAKAAGVPIVVAINKIDRETADPERVKQQLTEYGLVTEEWGGDTICVPVSAKKQINLDQLLEMVLLQADVLELKANPDRLAKGTIIEAQLDKNRGPVATVLVQNGTLKKGDMIVAGTAFGKVRAMMDDKGRAVNSAGPSTPVEVSTLR